MRPRGSDHAHANHRDRSRDRRPRGRADAWAVWLRGSGVRTGLRIARGRRGDAAHAMLPYMAQGAVQSIEDAAVLAKCLERADVHAASAALQRYEQTRKPRASRCQEGSRRNGIMYHLADGEDQRNRDANLASATTAPLPQNACSMATMSRPNSSMGETAIYNSPAGVHTSGASSYSKPRSFDVSSGSATVRCGSTGYLARRDSNESSLRGNPWGVR